MSTTTDELLKQVLEQTKNADSRSTMILQCVMLGFMFLKPVIMYWIQAKYNAPPPHESIMRTINDNEEPQAEIVDEGGTKMYRYVERPDLALP